jgi:hypothetical protein
MSTYTAGAQLWRRVRNFAQSQPEWAECIIYDVKPDEEWDATLIAYRAWGRREEGLAVVAAAGLDSFEHPIKPRRLVLPTLAQLDAMKLEAGYVTEPYELTQAQTIDPVGTR